MNTTTLARIDRLLEENDDQIIKQHIKKKKLDLELDPADSHFLDRKEAKKNATELLKERLKDRGKNVTPEMKKKFLKRFEPFYQDGTGDGLVLDKKTKKIHSIDHEADLENLIKGVSSSDWWVDVDLDKLNIQKQSWLKKTFG